ncbi:MAG: archaeosortase/exosortase family protein [Bacteroidia bacterium]
MSRKNVLFYAVMTTSLALWLVISAPYLLWFIRFLPLHFDLLHGLVALLVLGLSIYKLKNRKKEVPSETLHPLAMVFCLVGLAGIYFIRTQASIRIFGFSSALILLYGLLNPLMGDRTWKQGIFPFFLLLMTLPFGRHIDVFIGYPLRMAIVSLVNTSLLPLFPDLETYQGILVMENRASYVDMDCSGLRGLWVSWLIFLTLSWLEGIGNKLSWIFTFLLFSAWILIGNFLRIFLLIMIHTVWDQPELDSLVHQSVSLFFLLSACYFAFIWLRKRKIEKTDPLVEKLPMSALNPLLIACCMMTGIAFTPVYATRQAEYQDLTKLISRLEQEGWEKQSLSRIEQQVFTREAAQSLKFQRDSLEVIFIFNGDWNSQHKPELCYESAGIKLKEFSTRILFPGLSIREIRFEQEKAGAWYWFQQGDLCTSDFGEKVWTQIKGGNQKWTLVSILNKKGALPGQDITLIHTLLKNLNDHE